MTDANLMEAFDALLPPEIEAMDLSYLAMSLRDVADKYCTEKGCWWPGYNVQVRATASMLERIAERIERENATPGSVPP